MSSVSNFDNFEAELTSSKANLDSDSRRGELDVELCSCLNGRPFFASLSDVFMLSPAWTLASRMCLAHITSKAPKHLEPTFCIVFEFPKAHSAGSLNEHDRAKQALTNSHIPRRYHCYPTPAKLLMMLSVLS